MISLCVLACFIVLAHSNPIFYSPDPNVMIKHFHTFKTSFKKVYKDHSEHQKRFEVFSENLKKIEHHNSKNLSWKMSINKFGDLTEYEFKSEFRGLIPQILLKPETHPSRPSVNVSDFPEHVDWVSQGYVSEVKNQGSCGSCWAFSTTGAIEGAMAASKQKLVSLSEQELVDCSSDAGNLGCNGGEMDAAFEWVEQHGICAEQEYSYLMADGQCRPCQTITKISGFVDVPANDEDALLAAVSQQPVSVAIEADQGLFQFYESGVLSGDCGRALDHGVLLVGYGEENGKKYWKIKNSWGSDWGDQGYIKIERFGGKGQGMCGIAMDASYPVL